jgi:hypothetical protein
MRVSSALRGHDWTTRADEREFQGLLRRHEIRERVERRVRTLGALYLAVSALGILCAGIAFAAIAPWGLLSGDPFATALFGVLGGGATALLLMLSVPWLIGGLGLLAQRPWARVYAVMLAVLVLGWFPLGTLLGAYSLFVLLPSDAQHCFK